MRILHTSDWHLGRSFHGVGMLTHQELFLDHLLEVVAAEQVDLVVVSGDIYDRALPPVDAVALADDALVRLAHSRARTVLTSGNHDSALRLGFSSRLIDAAGVHLRTSLDTVGQPVLIDDDHGPVAVYGIPYLDPHLTSGPWEVNATHDAALGEAMRRVRADLATRGGRSVVMAHAFVAGAQPSESERDIRVGGVDRVPVSTFDGIDYVALGHLHGPHTLTEQMRYSGSPLAYSFSEHAQQKGSWLVELDAVGGTRAEFITAPVPRRLARLRGTLAELLADPTLTEHEGSWAEVTLTDPLRPEQPMEQIQKRFPHTVQLRFDADVAPVGWHPNQGARGLSEREIARDFITDMRGTEPCTEEAALLDLAFDACCEDVLA